MRFLRLSALTFLLCPALAWSQPVANGSEFLVNTFTANEQEYPSVARNGSGAFVIVWDSFGQDGDQYGVFGQRYDSSGSPVGGEFQVNVATPNTRSHPDVALDDSGGFVVVWGDYALATVMGRRFDSAGLPLSGEFMIPAADPQVQFEPAIATTPPGAFVAVWRDDGP